MEYGCPVSNRYRFASDDDDFEDPSELVQRAAKEAAIAKTAAKKVTIKTASQPAKKGEPKKRAEKIAVPKGLEAVVQAIKGMEFNISLQKDAQYKKKIKTFKEFKSGFQPEEAEFKTRKGGEGVQEDFGKLVPLQKKKDHTQDREVIIITRKECNKKVVPVNLQFAETRRDRQSGRGRERGGEGRGEHRGTGRGGQRTRGGSRFDASSAEDFPALAIGMEGVPWARVPMYRRELKEVLGSSKAPIQKQ